MSDGGSMCQVCGSFNVVLENRQGACLDCFAEYEFGTTTTWWTLEDMKKEMEVMMQDIEWRCDICGKMRPDAKINILVKHHDFKDGLGDVQENLKYCNDDPHCFREIRYFSYIKKEETNRFDLMDFDE